MYASGVSCGIPTPERSPATTMVVTVRVNVERHVRDEAARRIAEQGLMIGDTVRIVLEQAAGRCGPEFGALVPNPTTVAARRREVIELGSPAGTIAELNRDD